MREIFDDMEKELNKQRNTLIRKTLWEHKGLVITGIIWYTVKIAVILAIIAIAIHFIGKYW